SKWAKEKTTLPNVAHAPTNICASAKISGQRHTPPTRANFSLCESHRGAETRPDWGHADLDWGEFTVCLVPRDGPGDVWHPVMLPPPAELTPVQLGEQRKRLEAPYEERHRDPATIQIAPKTHVYFTNDRSRPLSGTPA